MRCGRGCSGLRVLLALAAAVAIATISADAFAGGAFLVNGNGEPLVWDTSRPIVFNTDQGPLGQLDPEEARSLAAGAFAVWGAVPTAALSFTAGELLPCDVPSLTLLSRGVHVDAGTEQQHATDSKPLKKSSADRAGSSADRFRAALNNAANRVDYNGRRFDRSFANRFDR